MEFEGAAKLTHRVPAGPEIIAPADGDIVPHDAHLLISWKKVTGPIPPSLGPVEIVGYHALVVDVTQAVLPPGKTKTSLDADLSKSETSFLVPKQYLEPNRIYELEILATEKGGNQTITEGGVFCTPPITPANCVKPKRSKSETEGSARRKEKADPSGKIPVATGKPKSSARTRRCRSRRFRCRSGWRRARGSRSRSPQWDWLYRRNPS